MIGRQFQTQRRTHRLETRDYTRHGAYFVTICAEARDGMLLNAAGEMILGVWNELPLYYQGIRADAFVVMPDHIHGIIGIESTSTSIPITADSHTSQPIVGAGPRARPALAEAARPVLAEPTPHLVPATPTAQPVPAAPTPQPAPARANGFGRSGQTPVSAPTVVGGLSLPTVVQRFKSLTTNRYIKGVRKLEWSPFEKRFWQRDYWERVIRDDHELEVRRSYILENPARWLERKGAV
ncbi:MAG: hypothetical protein HC933_14450 [Pleurocapsa sp. SU_196_0]|nr:hypothetical protein [Pleurocapsa sp. SU_196_0]